MGRYGGRFAQPNSTPVPIRAKRLDFRFGLDAMNWPWRCFRFPGLCECGSIGVEVKSKARAQR